MRLYWKHSKATICKHMKKNIGDLVVTKKKSGKTAIGEKRKKKYFMTNQAMGNFCAKK